MIEWTTVLNTFIATLPLTIGAITAAVIGLRKVEAIRHNTNSMKDALVKAAKAEGIAEGIESERAESQNHLNKN